MTIRNNLFKPVLGYQGKVLLAYQYQLERQHELLQKIKSTLPKNLANHALYCVISEKKISLYTDSAVWSSQLRFYHNVILSSLNASINNSINLLQIKIMPKIIHHETNKKIKLPSAENIESIFTQAENQSDEQLKSALLRLGSTIKRKTDLVCIQKS